MSSSSLRRRRSPARSHAVGGGPGLHQTQGSPGRSGGDEDDEDEADDEAAEEDELDVAEEAEEAAAGALTAEAAEEGETPLAAAAEAEATILSASKLKKSPLAAAAAAGLGLGEAEEPGLSALVGVALSLPRPPTAAAGETFPMLSREARRRGEGSIPSTTMAATATADEEEEEPLRPPVASSVPPATVAGPMWPAGRADPLECWEAREDDRGSSNRPLLGCGGRNDAILGTGLKESAGARKGDHASTREKIKTNSELRSCVSADGGVGDLESLAAKRARAPVYTLGSRLDRSGVDSERGAPAKGELVATDAIRNWRSGTSTMSQLFT